jgi:membrane associated rhomboid family serine protease
VHAEPERHEGDPRRQGIALVAALAAVMWVAEIIDQAVDAGFDQYGIEPRDVSGLDGIVLSPFLHAGFDHLAANTVPFIAMGVLIALSGLARVAAVTAIVALVGGVGTWLVAPEHTIHIGASGIVFGYGAYLIVRGLYSRRFAHLAAGILIVGIWGTTLLAGLAPEEGISWQGHLFGAVGGVVAARLLDRQRPLHSPVLVAGD